MTTFGPRKKTKLKPDKDKWPNLVTGINDHITIGHLFGHLSFNFNFFIFVFVSPCHRQRLLQSFFLLNCASTKKIEHKTLKFIKFFLFFWIIFFMDGIYLGSHWCQAHKNRYLIIQKKNIKNWFDRVPKLFI